MSLRPYMEPKYASGNFHESQYKINSHIFSCQCSKCIIAILSRYYVPQMPFVYTPITATDESHSRNDLCSLVRRKYRLVIKPNLFLLAEALLVWYLGILQALIFLEGRNTLRWDEMSKKKKKPNLNEILQLLKYSYCLS